MSMSREPVLFTCNPKEMPGIWPPICKLTECHPRASKTCDIRSSISSPGSVGWFKSNKSSHPSLPSPPFLPSTSSPMILPPAIEVVNGTHIVPLYFPTQFAPDQLDKLGWTAIITITWPNILGVIALILGTRDWYRVSCFCPCPCNSGRAYAVFYQVFIHATRHRLVLIRRSRWCWHFHPI